MYCKLICVFVLLAEPYQGWGMVYDIPRELQECEEARHNKTESVTGNPYTPLEEVIHVQCLQQFLWKTDRVSWSSFNITQKEMDYVNSLIPSLVRPRRTKRQTTPETGFRIRREYRRLSDRQRNRFHRALNTMKNNGVYNTFANLHRGIVVTSAHQGPNFFSWHRVYLSVVEESLRRINSRVSLPYFDSTMDFDMDNPVNSIIWSADFLGNGDGFVTTGPFANWQTSAGRLTRNIGGGSRLFAKGVIRSILTRCRTREISVPTALPQYELELAHGGPHVWIGGQMSGLNTAAHDPVFFLHHAFVDYIWERFRRRQRRRRCRVNPSRDYPNATGLHHRNRLMDGLPGYRNIDGYQHYWTRSWYRYERSPTCSRSRPSCGTPYLRCDVRRRRCISMARRIMVGQAPARMEGVRFAANAAPSIARANTARAEAATINVGPRFRAPPPESRTQDAMTMRLLSDARFERSPTCSRSRPSCGTPYLRCDVRRRRCITVARRIMVGQSPTRRMEGAEFNANAPASIARANMARAEAATINVGPRFRAPPPESRTQDALRSVI